MEATQLDPLTLAAKNMLIAKSSFNKAYMTYWHKLKPVSDEKGWKILATFTEQIKKFVFQYKRGDVGVENASWEIFRLVLVGQANYTFEDAYGFVKWYEQLKQKIGKGIGDLYDYHGDGFSDLIDSYPLAGKALVERAIATGDGAKPKRDGFLDESEVSTAVQEAHGYDWHKFICNGENYVESTLEKAAYKAFLQEVLTDDSVFPDRDAGKAVEYCGQYDD